MTTTDALDDRFEEAERGLEWLEKLEALQPPPSRLSDPMTPPTSPPTPDPGPTSRPR